MKFTKLNQLKIFKEVPKVINKEKKYKNFWIHKKDWEIKK